MTPVRRSIRNLPDNPKDSSDICLIIPFESLSLKQKSVMKVNQPAKIENLNVMDSRLEQPIEEPPQDTVPDVMPALRRSTRKTPSKYKSIGFTQQERVRNINFEIERTLNSPPISCKYFILINSFDLTLSCP